MPPFANSYWNNLPYIQGELTTGASDLVEALGLPKGNDLYVNLAYDTAKAVKAVDTDDIGKLITKLDKARLDYVNALRREHENEQKAKKAMTIENVIFNPPATIVFWADGTKTIVKCQDDEPFAFDPEKGLAMAFMKKIHSNKGNYYNVVNKWVQPYWQKEFDETCDWQMKFDEAAKALSAAFSDNKKGDEQS